MTNYPRVCPICSNPCYGRRSCRKCMKNKHKRYFHKKSKEKQIER